MQVWRACGVDVSLRDVTIAHIGSGVTGCEWRHAPEERGGFGGLRRKLESWKLDTERGGSTFGARWGETNLRAMGAARDGGKWKRQHRKIVSLSLCWKTFKLKDNKRFVPEQRSRNVFFVFRDSYVLTFLYMVMNIPCTFRIFMYMAMVHIKGW